MGRLGCVIPGFIALAVLLLGCESVDRQVKKKTFSVEATPEGATLWLDKGGSRQVLGPGPQQITEEYSVEVTDFKEWWWLSWAAPIGATVYGSMALSKEQTVGAWIGTVSAGIVSAIWGLGLLGFQQSNGKEALKTTKLRIGAELVGFKRGEMEVAIGPDVQNIHLRLAPEWYVRYRMKTEEDLKSPSSVPRLIEALGDGDVTARAGAATALGNLGVEAKSAIVALTNAREDTDRGVSQAAAEALRKLEFASMAEKANAKSEKKTLKIIAVFDIEDSARRFSADVLTQLTDYLSTRLTESGEYRVIPRSQMLERLRDEKKGSYKACIDDQCRVELGRELSASKTLTTRLLQVGKECAITTTIFDLKTATAERAASIRTGCVEGTLIDGMDNIAKQLLAQ